MADELGDRMKEYEAAESGRRAMRRLPVLARLDGICFSSFTRGLARPYDHRLSALMVATARHLVEACGASAGYTQSDEISLLFYAQDPTRSQTFLDGRLQKTVSRLAAEATGYFNEHRAASLPERADRVALFDCRVWTVPTKDEAANTFLWRELDATKNSVSMAAGAYYSHARLLGKTSQEKHQLLHEAGVNWGDYPTFFKRGTFVARRASERRFTAEELAELPQKHEARSDPELTVVRHDVVTLEMPRFSSVKNRVGVLFHGEEPQTYGPGDDRPRQNHWSDDAGEA